MTKTRQDFKVYQEKDTYGKILWCIRSGCSKGDVATNCNIKEQADYFAFKLNQDPWFLHRGDTRVERNKIR
jgi:hypothetical protein